MVGPTLPVRGPATGRQLGRVGLLGCSGSPLVEFELSQVLLAI